MTNSKAKDVEREPLGKSEIPPDDIDQLKLTHSQKTNEMAEAIAKALNEAVLNAGQAN